MISRLTALIIAGAPAERLSVETLQYGGKWTYAVFLRAETPSGSERGRPLVSSPAKYDTQELATDAGKALIDSIRNPKAVL